MSESALRCLIIDSDTKGHNNLRSALKQVQDFGSIVQVASLRELEEKLELGGAPESFFLANSLQEDESLKVLEKLKATSKCENSAIIMVRPSTEDLSEVRRDWFEKGADDVLFEPYSVDSISVIAKKIQNIKKDRLLAREREELSYRMKEIVGKVDVAAAVKSIGYEGSEAKQALMDVSREIQSMQQETLLQYFESVVETFEQAKPGEKVPEKDRYKGSSKNLKKRIERKMLKKVEERIAQEKQSS